MALGVQSLGGHMAGAVEGIDLGRQRDAETLAALRQALLDNLVLCVRGQTMDPHDYLAAMRGFGTPLIRRQNARHPEAEEINILSDGGDYGWPYCYGDRVPNPEYHDAARCARTIPPALGMQAHSAPLGITFLDRATAFPSDYRGDALVAFHGSWNRSVPTGAKVVRVRIRNDKPVSVEDFITGWQPASGSRWGRPVDVLVASDGSVLVSYDSGGAIYRVTAPGAR